MTTIATALESVKQRISAAAQSAGRFDEAPRLLAVSKGQPPEALREAFLAGQTAFGENYLQEALAKMEALADLPLEWHFIGPIQSNKTRPIAEHFPWVHSVDRLKVAQRLSEARADDRPPLNVCLQVNVSGEASKSGVAPQEVAPLALAVQSLPRLKLRGLMAIPEPTDDLLRQRRQFARLRELFDSLNARGCGLDTLSMGMSHDLEAAVAEGATIVRIGTAIFGARPRKGAPSAA